MREKSDYRDILARLYAMYPDRGCLSISDAAKYLGVSERTVRRSETIPKIKDARRVLIPFEPFARWLSTRCGAA